MRLGREHSTERGCYRCRVVRSAGQTKGCFRASACTEQGEVGSGRGVENGAGNKLITHRRIASCVPDHPKYALFRNEKPLMAEKNLRENK